MLAANTTVGYTTGFTYIRFTFGTFTQHNNDSCLQHYIDKTNLLNRGNYASEVFGIVRQVALGIITSSNLEERHT